MQLVLVGTNHNHAPIQIRERLSIQPQDLPARLKSLANGGVGVNEVVALSTCNRTEVYAVAARGADIQEYLLGAMSSWSHVPVEDLKERTYAMYDEEAVSHLITVASGLDSLVVGEEQIQGQVRDAAKVAKQAETAGRFLTELFQHAVRFSTKVRHECGFELKGASVSSAAVSLLRKTSATQPIHSILLIGAGKMITLAAGDLSTPRQAQVWVANRTTQRAEELAKRFGGKPIAFNKIPEILEKADAVLSCTSSPTYIITWELLDRAMAKRPEKPLILIDASVPRNIDPAVSVLSNVQLFNLDDLTPLTKSAHESLKPQLEKAGRMIREEAQRVFMHLRAYDANETLKDLMRMAEEIREQELSRALNKIGHVSDREKEILELLTRRIINKLLYEPTARLKEHMGNGDGEAYDAMVRELFAIDQENDR
jgi:glutamyl-tRNA reductase